jgi:hypothetical protein
MDARPALDRGEGRILLPPWAPRSQISRGHSAITKRGRPAKLTVLKQGEFCELLVVVLACSAAARLLGHALNTISKVLERDPAFRNRVRWPASCRDTPVREAGTFGAARLVAWRCVACRAFATAIRKPAPRIVPWLIDGERSSSAWLAHNCRPRSTSSDAPTSTVGDNAYLTLAGRRPHTFAQKTSVFVSLVKSTSSFFVAVNNSIN